MNSRGVVGFFWGVLEDIGGEVGGGGVYGAEVRRRYLIRLIRLINEKN